MEERGTGARGSEGWVRPTVLHSPLDPTRARPEPWFVGSGRGLMILVLSLCAVLLVARGVTVVWMAEAAWDWWRRPAPAADQVSAPATRPIPPIAPPALPAPPPAPSDVVRRPLATTRGSPGMAFSRDVYPVEALRRGEQGRVVARLAIGTDGRPTGCTVVTGSGSPSLDRATCAIGVARTRYRPARDAGGRSVPSRYDLAVRWALEE